MRVTRAASLDSRIFADNFLILFKLSHSPTCFKANLTSSNLINYRRPKLIKSISLMLYDSIIRVTSLLTLDLGISAAILSISSDLQIKKAILLA